MGKEDNNLQQIDINAMKGGAQLSIDQREPYCPYD